MGNQNPSHRRRKGKHPGVLHAFVNDALWRFEVHVWLPAKNTGDNILIEIGVCEETDPHLTRKGVFARPIYLLG